MNEVLLTVFSGVSWKLTTHDEGGHECNARISFFLLPRAHVLHIFIGIQQQANIL